MTLAIDTFSNHFGGYAYFKALGHPLVVEAAQNLADKIRGANPSAIFDPTGGLQAFAALHGIGDGDFAELFAQDISRLGDSVLGHSVKPVSELPMSKAQLLFIPAFDAARITAQIAHLIPPGCEMATLDEMRIPDRLLTDRRNYLNKLNFATNLLFFREEKGHHTRLVTANYWGAYGAKNTFAWCRLFDGGGGVLCDFEMPLGDANHTIILDSRDIKKKYNLPDFCGQVFFSIIHGAGHDIVKYVADTFSDDGALSCTHDANAWPSDRYAGIPAPDKDEKVILWIQNSHSRPIPAGEIALNKMGEDDLHYLQKEIPPFATYPLDIGELLPEIRWPSQVEAHAGKYFVRPRYEVTTAKGRLRINHANVERGDLASDPQIPKIAKHIGKGFLLPAPILPTAEFISECLPTPMSTAQQTLPIAARIFNAEGAQIAEHSFGNLPRNHSSLLNLSELTDELKREGGGGFGHAEIVYDFSRGGEADGWLHALFRYTLAASGHVAETSFGAHLFNHILTYKNEPQSYKGPPPGVTTRLFIRCAPPPIDTFFHLIYPVCDKWRDASDTHLELKNARGEAIAERKVHIPASGSRRFSYAELFSQDERERGGGGGYIIARDSTCRLFGYHGARLGDAFAFDHMFGF